MDPFASHYIRSLKSDSQLELSKGISLAQTLIIMTCHGVIT